MNEVLDVFANTILYVFLIAVIIIITPFLAITSPIFILCWAANRIANKTNE